MGERVLSSEPSAVPPRRRFPLWGWIGVAVAVVVVAGYGSWTLQSRNEHQPREQPGRPRTEEISEQIRGVRGHLERAELSAARKTLDGIPAAARQNPAVATLRDEVASREERRDNALRSARQCVQANDWPCAVRQAHTALGVDRTSGEARQLIEKITNLGLVPPAQTNEVPPSRPPGSAGRTQRAPSTGSGTAEPTLSECEATVEAGRRALAGGSYEQALASANDALSALGLCPGAQQLKQDAMRARDAGRR